MQRKGHSRRQCSPTRTEHLVKPTRNDRSSADYAARMGVLTVDLTVFEVVMSAGGQPIEALNQEHRLVEAR